MAGTHIFGFATFGHPNDFQQIPFQSDNKNTVQQIKVFDLSNAIKVFPTSTIYAVIKDQVGSSSFISYAIYSFAQEQASKRDGAFIGASIVLENTLADENVVVTKLNEIHLDLVKRNLDNGVLKVNHSKDLSSAKSIINNDKIKYNFREIDELDFTQTNKNLVVFCDVKPEKLKQYLKDALALLNKYDKIYFTDKREVAEYVRQKGIFPLAQNVGEMREFEEEIKILEEERKQKRLLLARDFEIEKEKVKVDKIRIETEYKQNIERDIILHKENERKIDESKNEFLQISQKFDNYLIRIDELVKGLETNQKYDLIKQLYTQNRIAFINSINKQTPFQPIHKIAKKQPQTELKPDSLSNSAASPNQFIHREEYGRKSKVGLEIFKILSAVLFLLWIGTLSYFLFFQSEKPVAEEVKVEQVQSDFPPVEQAKLSPDTTLHPLPTGILTEKEYMDVAKKIPLNASIDEVVDIIFVTNPSDINKTYLQQKKVYSNLIIERNKGCFKENDNSILVWKDTLKNIPCYKQKLK